MGFSCFECRYLAGTHWRDIAQYLPRGICDSPTYPNLEKAKVKGREDIYIQVPSRLPSLVSVRDTCADCERGKVSWENADKVCSKLPLKHTLT